MTKFPYDRQVSTLSSIQKPFFVQYRKPIRRLMKPGIFQLSECHDPRQKQISSITNNAFLFFLFKLLGIV